MRKIVVVTLVLLLAFSAAIVAQEEKTEETKKTFTNELVIPHTAVKNQARSGTCWTFCVISLLESELIRQGKGEYDLSEMFAVYHSYIERADVYMRSGGSNAFSGGGIDNDVFWVIRTFGMLRESDYNGMWERETKHSHGEMDRVLKAMVEAVAKTEKPSYKWKAGFKALLSAYLGEPPATIDVDGKTMTPREFADNVLEIKPEDYVGITAFTHLPLYTQSELVLPDNWKHHSDFYNVTLAEFMAIIDHALESGHTVSIGSDVSEAIWKNRDGMITWDEDNEVTVEAREEMWDDWSTTDDHGMHIVGVAKDENGKRFYYTKNSWGADSGPYQGYWYISPNFARAKFNCITIHKDALTDEMKQKLGLE